MPSRLFDPDSDTEFDGVNSVAAVIDLSADSEPEDLVLDKTLFDVLDAEPTRSQKDLWVRDPPAVTPSLSWASSSIQTHDLPTLASEEPSFYAARKAELRKKYGEYWNRVAPSPSPELEHDHLAEFEEWLATTNSIEFVG